MGNEQTKTKYDYEVSLRTDGQYSTREWFLRANNPLEALKYVVEYHEREYGKCSVIDTKIREFVGDYITAGLFDRVRQGKCLVAYYPRDGVVEIYDPENCENPLDGGYRKISVDEFRSKFMSGFKQEGGLETKLE